MNTYRSIGSVRSPIKRALIEMLKFGALSRRDGGWFSCNGAKFYDCTTFAMLAKQLAIYSINEKKPNAKFIRLSDAGIMLAKAVLAERDARAIATIAAERTFAEIARLNGALA